MSRWRSLEDDRDVSQSYARRYPDAVYDADDPEWQAILAGEAQDDESEDYDTSDDSDGDEGESSVTDRWDDYFSDDYADADGYYEIEIGIDYSPDGA